MPETSVEGVFSRPVAKCASSEVAAALTKSFEGYLLGPVQVDARGYERRFRAEHLDPFASRVYLRGDPENDAYSYAGVLLVARRGWTARVAGMGVVPELRGRGLGEQALREAIVDAEARGDREMVLEVFEQNAPALALYEKLGFRSRRRLFGYYRRRAADAGVGTPDALSEADPLEVARLVAWEGQPELPWMLSAETLSAATPPVRAYHLDRRAYAMLEEAGPQAILLSALLVRRPERRAGWGTRLLEALAAAFPDRDWYMPAIVPEGPAGAFLENSGWERERLNQTEMHLRLPTRNREVSAS